MPQPTYTHEDYYFSIISSRLYVREKRVKGSRWNGEKYWSYSYCGKTYAAHRLIWFLVTGRWPKYDIDHIDRNGNNNGFHNLREATRRQNCQNQIVRKNNKLKVKGVRQLPSGSYEVRIMLRGVSFHLGTYKTIEEATKARKRGEQELHTHASR
jgi:hypothetical protein